MIALRGVSAEAGGFRLSDVSFDVPRGGWGIVLGPAGSGKTTLLEAIAGVRRVAGGRIVVSDADVTMRPPEARGTGIVYQHSFLFPHLGVEENVMYGVRGRNAGQSIAERLGATALYGKSVSMLSGGERQIVALARALAPAPAVVLLDEPFAALDPRSRTRLREALRVIVLERETTVLQVTHDFDEARMLGDIAMVLTEGRMVQVARPDALFRSPASVHVADFLGVALQVETP